MPGNDIPDYLRHSAHKEIVDAIIGEPENQTLSSAKVYKNKVRADKLEGEIYNPVLEEFQRYHMNYLELMEKDEEGLL